MDKRCGTCAWGGKVPSIRKIECGYIVAEAVTRYLPQYMAEASTLMRPRAGAECPCWTPKEADDAR